MSLISVCSQLSVSHEVRVTNISYCTHSKCNILFDIDVIHVISLTVLITICHPSCTVLSILHAWRCQCYIICGITVAHRITIYCQCYKLHTANVTDSWFNGNIAFSHPEYFPFQYSPYHQEANIFVHLKNCTRIMLCPVCHVKSMLSFSFQSQVSQ